MELRASQIHCPECNAILQAAPDAEAVTCSYCGTSSQLQRRPRPPHPPRPPRPGRAPRSARQGPRRETWKILAVELVVAVVAAALANHFIHIVIAITVGVVFVAAAAMTFSFHESVNWLGAEPMLARLGRDEAVVGVVRYVLAGDTMHIAAFDSSDGRRRWETESLGNYADVFQSRLTLVGNAIIRSDEHGDVECRDVITGERRWQVSVGEVVKSVAIGAASDELVIQTVDDVSTTRSLRDGALRTNSRPPNAAKPSTPAPIIEGMSEVRVVGIADDSAIALGRRGTGTAVPMIAGLDVDGTTRWKSDVPSSDALTAAGKIEHVAIDERDVAVIYGQASRAALTVFDRATGRRHFDTALAIDYISICGVGLAHDTVLVSSGGTLQAFERHTGVGRFRIGSA